MKSFMEKVKNNKLRSACIGLSAFLFGFIAVSVFNNIGDTYAVSYTCPSGWVETGTAGKCCPSGYTTYNSYNDVCVVQGVESQDACRALGNYVGFYYDNNPNERICHINSKDGVVTSNTQYSWVFKPNATTSGTYGATWTSPGSGYYREGTVMITCSGDSCINRITSLPSIKRTGFKFVGWATDSSCSNGVASFHTPMTIKKSLTYYACWQKVDGCYSQHGYYMWGKYGGSTYNYHADYTTESACLANNPNRAPSQNPGDFTGGSSSSGGSSSGGSSSSEEPEPDVIADTIQYYKITYDLDGGKLIDGKTSKTQYVRGDKAVGTPGTNPIKDGYAFIQWEYNGNNFDFNTKLDDIKSSLSTTTENGVTIYTITLKATYAELDYSDMECPSGTVLDPSVRKCYSVLSDSSYPSYTLSTYSTGTRYCYAYNNSQGKPGGTAIHSTALADCPTTGNVGTGSAGLCKIEGKNNKTDGKYSEYSNSDAWMSENSCFVASTCTAELTDSSACEIRWDTIMYNVSDATIKEVTIPEVPVDEGEEPSNPDESTDPDDSGNNNDKDKTDDELTNNGKTGDALIFVAWVIGIGALAYSVYYFKLKKENI